MNIEQIKERQDLIISMKDCGNTFTSIGKKLKLTRQRCHQIYNEDINLRYRQNKFPRQFQIVVDGEVKNLLTRY